MAGRTRRRSEAGSDEQQLQHSVRPSVRPSVNLHCLTNSCHHHRRRFDWIDNKTSLPNCGLCVLLWAKPAGASERRLGMTFRRRLCLPLPASLSSATFEFSLMDRLSRFKIDIATKRGRLCERVGERARERDEATPSWRAQAPRRRNHSFTLGIIPIA